MARVRGRHRAARAAIAVLVALLLPAAPVAVPPAAAQELGLPRSSILTIETDRLFSDSAFGHRIANEIEAESAVLAAENRRIEAELTSEEKELTQRRSGMGPDAFRALADAFDEKVQGIRRTQEAKARALNQKADKARVEFLRAARPVLEALMRDTGAGVILERSS
ncbi:MAG: OmpH family outer membrane protein, partial [Pseudodonghicola sp.]